MGNESPMQPTRAPHRETPAGRRDWLVFSIIGWDFRIQRPQHLARELSRTGNATFYIEPHFIADAQAGYQIRQIDAHLPLYAVTLHLDGAPQIYFKAADTGQQEQLREQLSLVLGGIFSQQLLPAKDGGRVCAVEVLLAVPAVRNLIRTGRLQQLSSAMLAGQQQGMQTMEMAVRELLTKGRISREAAAPFLREQVGAAPK